MPRLEQHQSQITRTPEAPSVYMSPGTYDRMYAAYDSLGRQVSYMGMEFADVGLKLEAVEKQDEIVKGQLEYDRLYNEHLANRLKDPDYADWPKKFNEWSNQATAQILAQTKHPGARSQLASDFQKYKNSYEAQTIVAASRMKNAEARSRIPAMVGRYVNEAASNKEEMTPQIRGVLEGELRKYSQAGTIFSGEVDSYLADFDKGIEPVREGRIFSNAVELLKNIPDRQQARQFIDQNLVHVLSREQRNDLLAITNRRFDAIEAKAKSDLKDQQDKDKQLILDRIAKKQFPAMPANGVNDNIFDFINGTSLDKDEKKEWMTWAQARIDNEGKEIKSDPIEEARLEKMALDIKSGAVKYDDFVKQVNDSAFSKTPKIDEKAFGSLMSTANREHTTYQANAMGEAIDYGLRQLTHTDEQMNMMFLAPEFAELTTQQKSKKILAVKRLEEENFSQYKRALNEWFQSEKTAGRDPDDDDIYVKSRKLAVHYRGKALSESIYNEQEKPGGMSGDLARYFRGYGYQGGSFGGDQIPMVNSKEQFDALPAGSLFIAPDGSTRRKK